MKSNIQKLINSLSKNLSEYKIFNNTSGKLESAVIKTRDKLTDRIQNLTIVQELKTVPMNLEKPVPHKIVTWWQWYLQLTGLHSIEKARQQVILLQDVLIECQKKRRSIRQEAFMINNKLKEIYSELLSTRREDPKYVKLTIEENNNLREQGIINEKLNLLEEEEKDNFLHLTTAIKEYHDTQTMNSYKYKYIAIFATLISAILSSICSLIYQSKKSEDTKKATIDMQKRYESVLIKGLESIKQQYDNTSSNEKKQSESTWQSIAKYGSYVAIPTVFWTLKTLIGF